MITRCTMCCAGVTSLGLCGQKQAQRDRQRQNPLAHRPMGDDVVRWVSGGLCHAPRTARRAKAAPLAAEGDQFVVVTVAAAQPWKARGQDAAFEEGVELVLHKLRQVDTGSIFGPDLAGLAGGRKPPCTVRQRLA